MSEMLKVIGWAIPIIGVISVLAAVNAYFRIMDVINQGMTVAGNGGDVTPYIVSMMLILVAFAIPSWLKLIDS